MTQLTPIDGGYVPLPLLTDREPGLAVRLLAALRSRTTRRWLNLAVVVGAAYAAGAAPDPVSHYSAAAAALIALGAFAHQERAARLRDRHDQQLYVRFVSELPSNSATINWLRDADPDRPEAAAAINALARFLRSWDNVESEFDNEYLGSYLRALRRTLDDLLRLLIAYTPDALFDANALPVLQLRRDLGAAAAHTASNSLDRIRTAAASAYLAHQDLVWQGRRQL